VTWSAVVPVKVWRSAKSRLDIPGDVREELARALTLDTLDVLTSHPAVSQVVVVTADAEAEHEARSRGAVVLAEQLSVDPLNDAVRQGCTWVAASSGDGPTVVVPVDLAYLSAEILSATLASLAAAGNAHVPDLEGTGTTLLAAPTASGIDPHYGIGSSALHTAAGFPPLRGVDPRARADIDNLDDLASAWTPGHRVTALVGRIALGA
jgi:2-phospho-L-lactate guanylyltransferase